MASTGSVPPAPSRWRDAVTLTKPGITGLIVLVAVGGFFLAAPAQPAWDRLVLLVVTGTAGSAGAAMLNHYFDRDLDARMRRTRSRPLPADRIAPPGLVLAGGVGLLGGGVVAAALVLNPLTGVSILLGGLTYVVVYTIWLKRRSSWNIVIGGFAGSAPALAGGAAATGTWSPAVLLFALLVFLWTPPHFWSLALLLRSDYQAAGLPMLPRMDDPAFSGRVVVVSAAALVPPTAALWWVGPITWPAGIALVALAIGFVVVTAPLWRATDRPTALRGFVYSGPYLIGVIGALIVNWGLLLRGFAPAFG